MNSAQYGSRVPSSHAFGVVPALWSTPKKRRDDVSTKLKQRALFCFCDLDLQDASLAPVHRPVSAVSTLIDASRGAGNENANLNHAMEAETLETPATTPSMTRGISATGHVTSDGYPLTPNQPGPSEIHASSSLGAVLEHMAAVTSDPGAPLGVWTSNAGPSPSNVSNRGPDEEVGCFGLVVWRGKYVCVLLILACKVLQSRYVPLQW